MPTETCNKVFYDKVFSLLCLVVAKNVYLQLKLCTLTLGTWHASCYPYYIALVVEFLPMNRTKCLRLYGQNSSMISRT